MNKYDAKALKEIYSEHWKPGWGSIAVDEVLFVQDLIHKYQPDHFLEVGMASGLSGGILAQILEWVGSKSFTTIDYDNTFFGDHTKENGFLISSIYKGSDLQVTKRPFTTTIDLEKVDMTFQMAFIDANHQHPWPVIDTLCLYPYMSGPKIMVHHDLCLFRLQDVVYGIGPKYLYDQFPEQTRITTTANNGNIYALHLENVSKSMLEKYAADAFSLPWSLRTELSAELVEQLSKIFTDHYSQEFAQHFQKCVKKFNHLERMRTGV